MKGSLMVIMGVIWDSRLFQKVGKEKEIKGREEITNTFFRKSQASKEMNWRGSSH
jgi:hypothetical protein